MAGTIQSLKGVFDANTRDLVSAAQVLNIAVNGAGKKNRELSANQRKRIVTAQNQVAKLPDFVINARTTAAETFAVIELMTAKGVPFPAASLRAIDIELFVSGDATDETGYSRYAFTVSGGTTPLIRAGTLFTATPATMQVGGVYQAMAAAGLTATPACSIAAGAGTVTISVTSGEAEILNWVVKVTVGKLVPVLLGI